MKEDVFGFFRDVLGLPDDESSGLYADFLNSFLPCVEKLRGALSPLDVLAVREATHTIKGFAENVCAHDLAAAAVALNAAAHAADQAACEAGVREIERLWLEYSDGAEPGSLA